MEEKKNRKIYKSLMLIIITIFLTFIITTVLIGTYFINNPDILGGISSFTSKSSDLDSYISKYRSIIDQYYLGEIDEDKLKEGLIKGYVSGLGDPYSEYITKDEMKSYLEDTMGNFVGIGIYMVKNTEYNKIQVLSTIKGSPAEKAGVQPGDIIMNVDGVEYTADDMTVAANNIKGQEGTTVKIELLRGSETIKLELVREKVKVNQVEGKVLTDNIGYIKFTSFDESTSDDFKNEFNNLNSQGIKSLIIDLRNNGGGIVDEALDIADYIVEKDKVLLYEIDKNNNEKVNKSKNDPFITMPIVILANENTASASEILAGALKDLDRAKIVGTKTYGKGVIQQVLSLSDGSGLKLTVEEYQTPNRNKINKVGIEPDEKVELPDNVNSLLGIDENNDTQLQKAIEMLK